MISLGPSNGTPNSDTVNRNRETKVCLPQASRSSTSAQTESCKMAEYPILLTSQELGKPFDSSDLHFISQEGQDLPGDSRELFHFGAIKNGVSMSPHRMEEDGDNSNIERPPEALKPEESQIRLVFGDFNNADSSVSLERTESGSWKRKSHSPSATLQEPVAHNNLKKRRFQKLSAFNKGTDNPISHEKREQKQHVRESPVLEELDARRLFQRQKQVDFGKNTLGYDEYLRQIPR